MLEDLFWVLNFSLPICRIYMIMIIYFKMKDFLAIMHFFPMIADINTSAAKVLKQADPKVLI